MLLEVEAIQFTHRVSDSDPKLAGVLVVDSLGRCISVRVKSRAKAKLNNNQPNCLVITYDWAKLTLPSLGRCQY